MQHKKRLPSSDDLNPIAAALGESPEDTRRRGSTVLALIRDVFHTNAHGHRKELAVICARIEAATLIVETLQRKETDDYIGGNPDVAKAVLTQINRLQEASDVLRGGCETALANGNSQGPKQS